LDKCDKGILDENNPYAMVSHQNQHNYFTMKFLEACYKADHKDLADRVSKALHKDFDQQMKYYSLLKDSNQEAMKNEIQGTQQLMQMLNALEAQYKKSTLDLNPEFPGKMLNSDTGKGQHDKPNK
jgi:hypothetical protein